MEWDDRIIDVEPVNRDGDILFVPLPKQRFRRTSRLLRNFLTGCREVFRAWGRAFFAAAKNIIYEPVSAILRGLRFWMWPRPVLCLLAFLLLACVVSYGAVLGVERLAATPAGKPAFSAKEFREIFRIDPPETREEYERAKFVIETRANLALQDLVAAKEELGALRESRPKTSGEYRSVSRRLKRMAEKVNRLERRHERTQKLYKEVRTRFPRPAQAMGRPLSFLSS